MNFIGEFDAGRPAGGPDAHFKAHHVDSTSTHAPSGAIIVPDAHFLFSADFKRLGVDLILSNEDRELVLQDYFKGEKRAALSSPDGAHLTGDIVNALTGHVEYAQADGSADVAKVIGHVTKLAGTATAVRNGVSIILNQGDNVDKGDVLQSGSDSSLGVTFIDGTVFGLSSNARMVLNEMVYDPNGSNNSSLLSLVAGTISFVAGETAKHGDMKVDTPVATMGIRGTAVLVEIDFSVPGQGATPAANFQVLVEPDGTTGSYILFDKATLAPLATVNQAGTQTSISQGVVSFNTAPLSPDAQDLISKVFALKFTDNTNVNPKTTTAQNDTITPQSLAPIKLADGATAIPVVLNVNSSGHSSSSSPSGPTNSVQHIDGPPTVAAHGGSLVEKVGVTHSSAIDTASGKINFVDINAGDLPTVSAKFDSFTYQNAQHVDVTATLTAQQLADIAAVEVKLLVQQDAGNKNNGSATWTYSIADSAFDFIAAGETLTLTYMARVDNNFAPNDEAGFQSFTITITGTNDAPTVAATGSAITEQIGTGNTATDTASGVVTFADVDLTDRPIVSAHFSSFKYIDAQGHDVSSTLTAAQIAAVKAVEVELAVKQAAGNTNNGSATWTYSLADKAFDFLAKGETLILDYVAQVDDGHGGIVSTPISVSIGADVTITGTNDVPVITAATSNAFVELSNPSQPNPTGSAAADTVSGTISFTDVDLTDRPVATTAFTSFTYTNALHQALTLTPQQQAAVEAPLTVVQASGNTDNGSASWTYSAADKTFDFLAAGAILTLTYTATVDDGHGGVISQPFKVTVTGTNDTPVVAADASGAHAITEATTEAGGGVTGSSAADAAAGSLSFTDVDLTDTHAVGQALPAFSWSDSHDHPLVLTVDQQNALTAASTLTLTPHDSTGTGSGSVDFVYSAADSSFDFLAAGETLTVTYDVTVTDNNHVASTQPVSITITGTNDAPKIVGETNGPTQAVIVLSPIVLGQGVNTNSLNLPTETFNSQSHGSSSDNGAGHGNFHSTALDATFSGSGHAGVVDGSSAVTAAPFMGPLPGTADKTNYLSIGAGGTETITFAHEENVFGLYWGSVDPYNTIAFYHGATLVASYTGADIAPLFSTGNQGSFSSNGYVEFSGLASFDKVVLGSGNSNAFEIDNISAGTGPETHVELAAPISGSITVSDADIGDTLTASVRGNATFSIEHNGSTTTLPGNADVTELIDSRAVTFDSVTSDGGQDVLHWTYHPTNPDLDFLKSGDTLTVTFTAQVNDGHGNVGNQPLAITIAGTDASKIAGFAVVNGTSGNDTFANVGGNETIFGAGGKDTFVFHAGFHSATIGDFDVHNDTINIDHTLFQNVQALLASAHQSGNDTVITDAAHDAITLTGVTVAQIQQHQSDFHLV